MKKNGDWEPIDEVRYAWRNRVDIPHAAFEVLLQRHMRAGFNLAGHAQVEADARVSAAAITACVDNLAQTYNGLSRLEKIDALPRDNNLAGAMHIALTKPLAGAENPALIAYAAAVYITALEPHMPKNYWCSHPAIQDAVCLAIEDSRDPGTYALSSTLNAYYRLQVFKAALPAIAKMFDQTIHTPLSNTTRALSSHLHATQQLIRNEAAQQAAQNMTQPGLTPLFPLKPRPL
ncbi:MAG: hypothetical protein KKA05_05750 [Alphaproteobacteria bacterium]|nr:hypothetical protein [Alphaproteobacteria bacterium]MBU0858355.1 hypothetical protein [Alphaproteobacteria bacterium]